MTGCTRANRNTCVVECSTSKRSSRSVAGFASCTSDDMRRWFFHHIGISSAVTSRAAHTDATVVHGRRHEASGAVTQVTRSSGWNMRRWFAYRSFTVTSGTRANRNTRVVECSASK